MRKPWWIAAVGLVGAVAVCTHRGGGRAVAHHPELAPAARAIAYRFDRATPTFESEADDAAIAQLEARDRAAGSGSVFDAAELADIYERRGARTGSRADYAAAERYAVKSLAVLRHPNGALMTLARVAAARHHFAEAIALAEEQLAHKPTAAAYELIATARLALGQLPEAAQAAQRAIEVKPDSGGYTTRALIEEARGEDAAATADFARAVAVERPGLEAAARLRALWARLLIRRGQLAGARDLVDEALALAPDLPLAIAQRGELALRAGDRAAAAADFERAFAASRQVRYLIDEARAEGLPRPLLDQIEPIVRGELAAGPDCAGAARCTGTSDGLGHALDLIEVLVDRGTPRDLAEAVAVGRAEVERRGSWEVRLQLARAEAKSAHWREADDQLRAILATGAREAPVFALAATVADALGDPARADAMRAATDDVGGWAE